VKALAAVLAAGLRVRIEPLGRWGATALLAEYDPARRTIGIDAGAVARMCAAAGEGSARRFIACALWHELFHHRNPGATEAAAHAFARERCGDDPQGFSALLRSGSGR